MSENNKDDLSEKFSRFADSTVQTLKSAGKTAWNRLDEEKQKAELKNEISSCRRELNSVYEKLGREYYEKETSGTEITDEKDLFNLIHEKIKTIDLLKEKLEQFS